MKSYNNWILLLAIAIIFAVNGCSQNELPLQEQSGVIDTATYKELPKGMSFEAHIPENTPKGDTVWIYVRQKPYKMEDIGNFTYKTLLNETQLFGDFALQNNEKIAYRYSRNGYDFKTAEYLAPTQEEPDRDTNNYFWTRHGRETYYEHGKTQKDKIDRWRWFPDEGYIGKTSNIEPHGNFMPRLNDEAFMSGQVIEDLYVPAFHDFFNSTATHLKEQGYKWIEIDPPWQWAEEEGYPKVVNDVENNPNYPDDKTFLEELNAYKKEGLHVLVAPQLCCTPLDTKGKPKEWWQKYFGETERFLLHFAELSEKGGADAFMYAVPSWEIQDAPLDVGEKWSSILKNVRKTFNGKVGEMVWMLGPEVSAEPQPIPNPDFIAWHDQLDFIYISTEFPLSMKDNPSDGELYEGAALVLDGMKPFYEKFKKPVIVRNGYFNVKYSWKGQSFYSISSVPWISEPEIALKESKYEFDAADHARTIDAYFRAIAERPWIAGYFHFGYTHWEDPLSAWMSIRGKPAEDVWRKWNEDIYS